MLHDPLEYSIEILHDVVVPEAKHLKPIASQPRVTAAIQIIYLGVLPTIELDHQLGFEADEIHDVRPDRPLALEFVAAQLGRADACP